MNYDVELYRRGSGRLDAFFEGESKESAGYPERGDGIASQVDHVFAPITAKRHVHGGVRERLSGCRIDNLPAENHRNRAEVHPHRKIIEGVFYAAVGHP